MFIIVQLFVLLVQYANDLPVIVVVKV